MGDCALHTVTGRNSRRRKGLKPSWRSGSMDDFGWNKSPAKGTPPVSRITFQTRQITEREATNLRDVQHWVASGGGPFIRYL